MHLNIKKYTKKSVIIKVRKFVNTYPNTIDIRDWYGVLKTQNYTS